jgi:hypothetical protein
MMTDLEWRSLANRKTGKPEKLKNLTKRLDRSLIFSASSARNPHEY